MNEIAAYIDSLLQFDTTVQLLNTDLYTMVQDIEAFDEQITTLTDSIGQLNETIAAISIPERNVMAPQTNSVVHYNNVNTTNEGDVYGADANNNEIDSDSMKGGDDSLFADAKDGFKKIKTTVNYAKYGLQLSKHFGYELPEALEYVKKAGEIADFGGDVAEFGEAAEGIGTALEIGSAMDAASGIAAALAGSGVGLVAGGLVLAGGYIIDRQKAHRVAWEKEQKDEHDAIVKYATDKEKINEFVNETPDTLKTEHKQIKQLKVDPRKNDIFSLKLGDDMQIAQIPGITAVADNVRNNNRLNISPQPVSAKKVTNDISTMLFQIGLGGENGKENLKNKIDQYYAVAAALDKRDPLLHATDIVSTAQQQAKVDLSIRAFQDKEVADYKKKIEAEKETLKRQQQGNTIILNMNKAMIENFTVNATNVKESTAEIKHIVEQTLLETLQHVHANG